MRSPPAEVADIYVSNIRLRTFYKRNIWDFNRKQHPTSFIIIMLGSRILLLDRFRKSLSVLLGTPAQVYKNNLLNKYRHVDNDDYHIKMSLVNTIKSFCWRVYHISIMWLRIIQLFASKKVHVVSAHFLLKLFSIVMFLLNIFHFEKPSSPISYGRKRYVHPFPSDATTENKHRFVWRLKLLLPSLKVTPSFISVCIILDDQCNMWLK